MLTNSTRFKTDWNFVKDEEDGKYYFKGYYDRKYEISNYLKFSWIHQVATIISLWNEEKCFPISFYPLPGFTEEDQTEISKILNKIWRFISSNWFRFSEFKHWES